MKAVLAQTICDGTQDILYFALNKTSETSIVIGCLAAFPVAVIDVAVDTACPFLSSAESAALIIVNVAGAAFSRSCKLKEGFRCLDHTVGYFCHGIIKIINSPIKLFFQTFANFLYGNEVGSSRFFPSLPRAVIEITQHRNGQ